MKREAFQGRGRALALARGARSTARHQGLDGS